MIVVAQCVALLLSLQSLFCFPLPARIRTFQNGDKKLSRAALSSARKRDSTSAICSTGTFDPDNVDSVDSLGTCSNQSQQALKIPSFVSKVDDLESPALPHASPFAYSSSSLLYPNPSCDVDRMSGTDLAYMGDVVYELFVRSRLVWPQQRTSDRQDRAVMLVRGES